MSILFLVAAGVRVLYVLACVQHPEFMIPLIDASTYDTFARQWVELGLRDSTTAWHAAFYPLFLAAVYRAFSPSVLVAMLVQAALGAAACCCVAGVARRCFGERAMWLAGLMAAAYGPLIFYDVQLMPAGWSFLWSACILASLTGVHPSSPWMRGMLYGLLSGGAALIRPELLAGYVGGGIIWKCSAGCQTRTHDRATGLTVLTAMATFAVVVLPIGKMNRPWTGTYAFWPVNGALALYISNAPDPCDTMLTRPGPAYDRIVNRPKQAGLRSAKERNRYYVERVMEHVRHHPRPAALHILRKGAMLFNGREVPTDLDLYTARPPARWTRWILFPLGPGGFPFSPLVVLAGLGLFRPAYRKMTAVNWTYLVVAGLLVILLPTARYRLILLPPLFVFAAAGALSLLDGSQRQKSIRRPAASLLVSGLLVLQLLPFPLCRLDWDFAVERERMIAQRIEDPIAAMERLTPLLLAQPSDPQTPFFLAVNAWKLGEAGAALSHLEAALALAPDYAYALLLKSEILAQQDDWQGAQLALMKAVRSAPDLDEAHMRLALLHAQAGDFPAARAAIQDLLAGEESHPIALHLLADIDIQEGHAARAMPVIDRLLQKNPDQPDLHASAAQAAWQLQRVSVARHHALEALRLQPGHPRAAALLEEMNRIGP